MTNQPLDFIPMWALYFLTVLAMLVTMEAGYRLNQALRRRSPEKKDTGLGGMVGASLGLLAFLLILLLGAAALALLVVLAPYRMQRLIAFLDPWSVAFGSGYQLTQALIAFGRGEVFGLGLGEGVQKLYYLPEAHNDFIFAVVAEELGGAGAIFLALLLAYLVVQLFLLARRHVEQRAHFAAMAAYFTGLVLGIQFLVNLGVNTGVLPTKGLTLPFVSYGGNSLIICCALLALVLRTSHEAIAQGTGRSTATGTAKGAAKGAAKGTGKGAGTGGKRG